MTAANTTPDRRKKSRFLTLEALDGRTLAAKYAHDLLSRIETDLGGDLTAAQREIAQRAAVLGAYIVDFEARFLSGEATAPDAVGTWLSAANNQRRMFETLGIQRVARDVSLSSYLSGKTHQRTPQGDTEASGDEDIRTGSEAAE
jgi:hypothetical protein